MKIICNIFFNYFDTLFMNISNYAFNKITYQSLDMDKKIAVRTITFAPPLLKTIS